MNYLQISHTPLLYFPLCHLYTPPHIFIQFCSPGLVRKVNCMSNRDLYSDDPVEFEQQKSKKRVPVVLVLIAALIGGTIYIQTTLAANISLNSGSGVEFGQGVTQTVACSGSDLITVTPIAGFVNSSGAGTFKFSSIRVDDIPAGCQGSDFAFSAYDNNAGSAAQAIFNTTSTRAVVYIKSDGTFEIGIGGTGATVTRNSSTSFTINFTSPVALSDYISKLTVESGVHTPRPCSDGGDCVIGDTGPGGGKVFFVKSLGAFSESYTELDPWCDRENCPEMCFDETFSVALTSEQQASLPFNYLEVAPTGRSGGIWGTNGAIANNTSLLLGSGAANTDDILLSQSGIAANNAARYAKDYAINGVDDWYLPSYDELLLIMLKVKSGDFPSSDFPLGLWASSTEGITTAAYYSSLNQLQGVVSRWDSSPGVRPIRSF